MNLENIKIFLDTIFSFNDKQPLLFTQFYFWFFFAVVFALFSLLRNKILMRNTFLFFASLFFYYKTSGLFVLLLFITVVYGFFIGKGIDKTNSARNRKLLLALGVVLNLGVLFYFKYAYFFTDVYNSFFNSNLHVINWLAKWANGFFDTEKFDVGKIILPVGISFFTFQNISYIVDIYRKKIKPVQNVLDYGFYLTFFPQLVAGPIVRADVFIPQLHKKYFLSKRQFGIAIFWILNGLLKKIILSDYLAVNYIDRVFSNPMLFTGFENLMALFVYSLQVYADFSGYTDIAIGVAMIMGFYLPKNFNSPYKATNASDFWRRWHISLSQWLRDYLYIPLGGNRHGKLMTNVNLMTTMLLGGMWHGASWNFIIWGGLNGIGVVVYKYWRKMTSLQRVLFSMTLFIIIITLHIIFGGPLFMLGTVWVSVIFFSVLIRYCFSEWLHFGKIEQLDRIWGITQTFVFISFTRLFFRSGSNLPPAEANATAWQTAKNMVTRIGGKWDLSIIPQIVTEYRNVFLVFLIGMIIHWLPEDWKRRYRIIFASMPLWATALIVVAAVFILYQFVVADLQPFIYFQF